MRRYERRGKEAPMDFTYEREQRDVGQSPFTETYRRQNSQPPLASSSRTSTAGFPPLAPSFNTAQSFGTTNNLRTTSSSISLHPPGSFQTSNKFTPEPRDVTMESPARDDDEYVPGSDLEDEEYSPTKPKAKKTPNAKSSNGGGKLIRKLMGKAPKSPTKPPTTLAKRRTRRNSSLSVQEQPSPSLQPQTVYHVNFPSDHPPSHASNHLTAYARFFFYVIGLGSTFLILYLFMMTIRADVDAKITEYSSEILHEIGYCSKLYLVNKCHPETRIPAMEATCQEWERCMNKDPKVVSRARVWAETLGEMFNGFVEPIAWKTLAFTVVTLLAITFAAWSLLKLFGHWTNPHPHPSHQNSVPMVPSYALLPPPTPTRSLSMQLEGTQSPYPGGWVPAWSDPNLPTGVQTPRGRSRSPLL